MTDPVWAAVDRYLEDLAGPEDPVLSAAIAAGASAGLPAIQVSALQGRLLALLVRLQGARRVLEVGTLFGYSTIWMARALPADGRLLTLELESRHAEVARANLARAGVAARVEVRVGPALESLHVLRVERSPPFDLVFVDADKEGYPAYLDAAIGLARPGTLLIADNVVRGGRITDAEDPDPRVRSVRTFLQRLATDPRVESVVVPMAGAKGYDGFALARVR